MIAPRFVIHYRAFDFWVIAVLDLLTGLNVTHGEAERRLTLFVLVVDLLRGFLRLLLGFIHSNSFQLVRAAMDLRNGLQDGIGVFRRHGIELTDTLLSIEVLDGT